MKARKNSALITALCLLGLGGCGQQGSEDKVTPAETLAQGVCTYTENSQPSACYEFRNASPSELATFAASCSATYGSSKFVWTESSRCPAAPAHQCRIQTGNVSQLVLDYVETDVTTLRDNCTNLSGVLESR